MDVKKRNRKFLTGMAKKKALLCHCADIRLLANEQITFKTKTGRELDFTAKEWGFYPLPSMNSRLVAHGFQTALVQNPMGKVFINVVDKKKMKKFLSYLRQEKGIVLEWLDERPLH